MRTSSQTTETDYYTRAANDDDIYSGPGTRTKYSYDANGNAVTRNGFPVVWASYNHPSLINSSGESVRFAYDQNHERYSAVYNGAMGVETTYFVGGLLEKVVTAGSADYRHFIYAGGTKVAVYSRTTAGVNTLRYIREDHEGSAAAILSNDGTSYVKESFTAFGAQRSACTWSGPPTNGALAKSTAVTRHGYTWQTALGMMGLNDMNGRIQDSLTGRFLSADPHLPSAGNTQDFNRYSYVRNNPLSLIDPTGFGPEDPHNDGSDDGGDGSDGGGDGTGGGPDGGGSGGIPEVRILGTPPSPSPPPPGSQIGQLETVTVSAPRERGGGGGKGAAPPPPLQVDIPTITVVGHRPQANPSNPLLCDKAGVGCPTPTPPPTQCLSGGDPSPGNNPQVQDNIKTGAALGASAGGVAGSLVVANLIGFPEVEVAEAGGGALVLLSAAEGAHVAASGGLMGGLLFGTLGGSAGYLNTYPICP